MQPNSKIPNENLALTETSSKDQNIQTSTRFSHSGLPSWAPSTQIVWFYVLMYRVICLRNFFHDPISPLQDLNNKLIQNKTKTQ